MSLLHRLKDSWRIANELMEQQRQEAHRRYREGFERGRAAKARRQAAKERRKVERAGNRD